MHPEALDGIAKMVVASGFETYALTPPVDWSSEVKILDALDLGGADVNGTARDVVDRVRLCHWTGADIEPGPGVDWVMDATQPPADKAGQWDVVLCTEVLEHVREWFSVVLTIYNLLKPGGFAFISCASSGRRPHGARGALWPEPGEWYGNIPAIELDNALAATPFYGWTVTYNPSPGDAYAWARK